MLILSTSFVLSAQPTSLEQLIADHREVGYKGGEQIDTLLEFFLLNRYAKHRGAIPNFEEPSDRDFQCIYHLVYGEHHLYGPDRKDSLAYESFLEAYEIAQELESDVLQCESLRRIISYCQFTQTNLEEVKYFIDQHRRVAYDEVELLTNDLFDAKWVFEKIYRDTTADRKQLIGGFPEVIERAVQLNAVHVATEAALVLAIAYGINDRTDESVQQSRDATSYAEQYSSLYLPNVSFTAVANIGWAYFDAADCSAAITNLRLALDLMPKSLISEQSVKMYDWLSTCYHRMNLLDSAVHYYRLYGKSLVNKFTAENEQKIAEIQAKYEDEQKSRKLAEEQVKVRNYALASAVTAGLLSLSLLNYRRLHIKRRLLREKLNSAEQRMQLAAINAQLDGREIERRAIASRLHDSIVGYMVATKVQLKALASKIGRDQVEKASSILDISIDQTRNLSHELYPPLLASLGLGPALADLVEKYSSEEFECIISGDWDQVRWKGNNAAKVYYVVQELITNSVKHSMGNECHVFLELKEDSLLVSVHDNGQGLKSDGVSHGLGISTVISRVSSLGSNVDFADTAQGVGIKFLVMKKELQH